jgi:hypothetical protein
MTHEEDLLHRLTQKSVNPKYLSVWPGMSVQIHASKLVQDGQYTYKGNIATRSHTAASEKQ